MAAARSPDPQDVPHSNSGRDGDPSGSAGLGPGAASGEGLHGDGASTTREGAAASGPTSWEYRPASDHGLEPVKRWRSERREPGLISAIVHSAALLGLKSYLRLYHRIRIEGIGHLPRTTPFIISANHASHMDALVIAASLPREIRSRTFPIAAGDVFFEVPAMAALTALFVNALPMWRKKVGRHALDDLRNRLHAGDAGYILFPEGARTRTGEPLPFKPGVGMLVAGTAVPVVPARLRGCFEALRPNTTVPRPVKITVSFGTPLRFDDLPPKREGWDAVSARVRDAIFAM